MLNLIFFKGGYSGGELGTVRTGRFSCKWGVVAQGCNNFGQRTRRATEAPTHALKLLKQFLLREKISNFLHYSARQPNVNYSKLLRCPSVNQNIHFFLSVHPWFRWFLVLYRCWVHSTSKLLLKEHKGNLNPLPFVSCSFEIWYNVYCIQGIGEGTVAAIKLSIRILQQ